MTKGEAGSTDFKSVHLSDRGAKKVLKQLQQTSCQPIP